MARSVGNRESPAATESGAWRWMLFSNKWRCLWHETRDLRFSNVIANAGRRRKRRKNAIAASSEKTSRPCPMSFLSSNRRTVPGRNRLRPMPRIRTLRHSVPPSGSQNVDRETNDVRGQKPRGGKSAQAGSAGGCGAEAETRGPKDRCPVHPAWRVLESCWSVCRLSRIRCTS